MVLLNAVLTNIPTYFFSFFNSSKVILHEISFSVRFYGDRGDDQKRKFNWISWESICKLKKGELKENYFVSIGLLLGNLTH